MPSPESLPGVFILLLKQSGLLALVMGIVVAPTCVYAYQNDETLGVTAVSAAAGACFVGGFASLFIAALMRYAKQDRGIIFLTTIIVRFGVVVAVAFAFFVEDGDLGDAGVLHYLVFFYITMLWADVWILIREDKEAPSAIVGSATEEGETETKTNY